MSDPVLALDCDGVLLDFHLGYAGAWARAFGTYPAERDRDAYWPIDRWQVERLEPARRDAFRSAFDATFWSTLPAIDGALEACRRLHAAGYALVCVTALPEAYAAARWSNLQALGFPIERVIATGHAEGTVSPKADAIEALRPLAFVDDYAPYFRGLPRAVHKALVQRAPNGSPNTGADLALADSTHADLATFSRAWLARGGSVAG